MHEHEFLYFSLHGTQPKAAWYPSAPPPCFTPCAPISACYAASQMTAEASVSRILHCRPVSLQKICDFCYRKK